MAVAAIAVTLAAGAPAPDQALISGTYTDLARQAGVVVTGSAEGGGTLKVERYLKGAGPDVLPIIAPPLPKGRIVAFLEAVPGVSGRFRPVPLGAAGEVGLFALDGDRIGRDGPRLADVMAEAEPSRDWRKRLQEPPEAIRQ